MASTDQKRLQGQSFLSGFQKVHFTPDSFPVGSFSTKNEKRLIEQRFADRRGLIYSCF